MSDYHAGYFRGGPSVLDTEVRDLLDAQRANEDKQRWLKWEMARATRHLTAAKIKDAGCLSDFSHHQVTCQETILAGFKTQLLSAQCYWREPLARNESLWTRNIALELVVWRKVIESRN